MVRVDEKMRDESMSYTNLYCVKLADCAVPGFVTADKNFYGTQEEIRQYLLAHPVEAVSNHDPIQMCIDWSKEKIPSKWKFENMFKNSKDQLNVDFAFYKLVCKDIVIKG